MKQSIGKTSCSNRDATYRKEDSTRDLKNYFIQLFDWKTSTVDDTNEEKQTEWPSMSVLGTYFLVLAIIIVIDEFYKLSPHFKQDFLRRSR
jgi:hypothetical protein